MSIQYRLTPMRDNISEHPKEGFYAQVVSKGTVDVRMLCDEMANGCSLTPADMQIAIAALAETIASKLQDGYNISIDELGIFSVSADSSTAPKEDEINPQSIRVKTVHFRPSVRLKTAMRNSSFECIITNK